MTNMASGCHRPITTGAFYFGACNSVFYCLDWKIGAEVWAQSLVGASQ